MAELSWLLHFDCRLHSESDTRNISAGFKQTVERASSPLQYAHEYIYFTAETLWSISAGSAQTQRQVSLFLQGKQYVSEQNEIQHCCGQ